MTAETWTPAPGDKVVALRQRGHSGSWSIERSTVARVGKRDVVLENGDRFPVATLVQRANSAWDPATTLHQPDDPKVRTAVLANRRENGRAKISTAHDAFRRDPSPSNALTLAHLCEQYAEIPS